MAIQKADVGHDFATVLARASEKPMTEEMGKDLPDGFPFGGNPANHRIVAATEDEAIAGVVAYDFKIHRRVFTLYRPWEDCSRCANALSLNAGLLPVEQGDYSCPHVEKDEYERITNDILAGKLMFGSEQEIVQKNGSIVISLRWYEKKIDHKKMRERRKALEKKVATRTSEDLPEE